MSEGYIYCISNCSMPGLLKIGMTKRTPTERLSEANAPNTWGPPTPYVIEFAKKVNDVVKKEKMLHNLLAKYAERVHPQREFFRASTEQVLEFFNLIDGEMWAESKLDDFLNKPANTNPINITQTSVVISSRNNNINPRIICRSFDTLKKQIEQKNKSD